MQKDSMFQAFSQNEELVLQKLCGFRLTPSPCSTICPVSLCLHPQEDDANFFGFSKKADDGSPPAGRPSKTCPDVPHEFRVSCGMQESRLIIPRGLGILKVDWELEIFQSCSVFQDHKIILRHSRNSPCPPEAEPKADSRLKDSLCVVKRVHRVSTVELHQLPHSKFFVIFLGTPLRDLPEKQCFSNLIHSQLFSLRAWSDNWFALSSVLWDWSCRPVSERAISAFRLPILFCLFQPVFQIIMSELQILLDKLVQLPFQGIREDFSVQT